MNLHRVAACLLAGVAELSGRTTIEGAGKRTAKEIGDQLKVAFQRQGWI